MLAAAVLAAMMGCALPSCRAEPDAQPGAAGPAPFAAAEQGGALPPPSGLWRSASAAGVELRGVDYDTGLPNHHVNQTYPCGSYSPDYDPAGPHTFDGLAYAIYAFDMAGYTGEPRVSTAWLDPAPAAGLVWLGLGNLPRDRWDWYALPAGGSITPPALTDYVSPAETMLVAVAVMGAQPALLDWIWAGVRLSAYYETEDNDAYEQANALPPLPFPPPTVRGSLGALPGYDGYDGDSTDWYTFSAPEAGLLRVTLDLQSINGSSPFTLDFYRNDAPNPPLRFAGFDAQDDFSGFLYLPAAGAYWVQAYSVDRVGDYLLAFDFTPLSLYETEDNDVVQQANALPSLPVGWGDVYCSVGYTANPDGNQGEIVYDGDSDDWFSFSVDEPGPVAVQLEERFGDADFELYANGGKTKLAELKGDHDPERLVVLLTAAGTYYIHVMPGTGGGHVNYFIEVEAGGAGAGWLKSLIDGSGGGIGEDISAALVGGNPAVCYFDSQGNTLYYSHALDANGAAWSAPVAANASAGGGEFCSLAEVNGWPAIAYHRTTMLEASYLEYVRAADAEGLAWGGPVTIDGSQVDPAGKGLSLAVVDGRPAISYFQTGISGRALRYVRADDADGGAWSALPVEIDPDGGMVDSALVIADGNPAVGYMGYASGEYVLRYARAMDADGGAWNAPATLFSTNGRWVGRLSAAVVSGNPAIVFETYDRQASTGYAIEYIRASDASGDRPWGAALQLDSRGAVKQPSLAVIAGAPGVAYYDETPGDLLYAYAQDALGGAWNASETADAQGTVGEHPSLLEVSGKPGVAYRQKSLNAIKFVVKY
jgi:hypothetical protein